jgi:hypothetical protein
MLGCPTSKGLAKIPNSSRGFTVVRALISRRSYTNIDKMYYDSGVSRPPWTPVSATGLFVSLQVRYICFGIQLATAMFAGCLVDTLVLDEIVTMCSGTMTPKVVFRLEPYLARRKWTLLPVVLPVSVESVEIGKDLAAGAIGAFKRCRRLRTHFKFCCHV